MASRSRRGDAGLVIDSRPTLTARQAHTVAVMARRGEVRDDRGMTNTQQYSCDRCQMVTQHMLQGQTWVCLRCVHMAAELVSPAPEQRMAPPRPQTANPPAVVVCIGGAVIVVAAFLPWIDVTAPLIGHVSRSGVDMGGVDAWMAAGLGALLAASAGLNLKKVVLSSYRLMWLLAAIAAGVVAGIDLSDIMSRVSAANAERFGVANVGIGMYLEMTGAGAAAVGALLNNR